MPVHEYNFVCDDHLTPVELELLCFRSNWPPERGGLGAAGHFRRLVELCWPANERFGFTWHPWAERGLAALTKHKYLALSGCSASGKSALAAMWGLVNWLAAPAETLVMVTSTSLKDSRRRIWGYLTDYFNAVPWLPGRLIDSLGVIRTVMGDGRLSERSGIALIAADPRKEREAVGRIIGAHNRRVLFIADEMPELSPAVVEAALGNLSSNPVFQLVGLGNFNSIDDPFGQFCEPKNGWESVTVDMKSWPTKLGWCERFAGTDSPNLGKNPEPYPFLYGQRHLEAHKRDYGEDSPGFWRFCLSFPPPSRAVPGVISRAEVIEAMSKEPVVWLRSPVAVAGLDPAFTEGGDLCSAAFGRVGLALAPNGKSGRWVIEFTAWRSYHETAALHLVPRARQIARQFAADCMLFNVKPAHVGVDVTGAGTGYADAIEEEFGSPVHRVDFGGAPSSHPVSSKDPTPARKKYANRMTELWMTSREYLLRGHVRGVTDEVMREATGRRFEKSDSTNRMRVESKVKMYCRGMTSPNRWDAACVLLDVVREVLGFEPGKPDEALPGGRISSRLGRTPDRIVYAGLALKTSGYKWLGLTNSQNRRRF